MKLSANGLSRTAGRLGAAARNAVEVARYGGLDTGQEGSPYVVAHATGVYRLRHYFADPEPAEMSDVTVRPSRPPVLLVPPMMLAAEVYDVSPESSGVALLSAHGADPWVVDFGAPEREEGGLERTLTDHILAVSDAVEVVAKATGQPVHVGGYSQGGMFCYQTAAYRRSEDIASLVTFGSSVDTSEMIPLWIPEDVVGRMLDFLADNVLSRQYLPAWASRTGFRLLDPVKSLRQRVDFLRQLHDREALIPREKQRQFLMREGWVAWPGPALADLMKQIVAHNRMLSGGFTIEDRLVTLADITCPLLAFVGEVDEIAPMASVRAIRQAAPLAEVYEKSLHAGHFGLVVGSLAATSSWPTVARWARWRSGAGDRPDDIELVDDDALDRHAAESGRPSPITTALEGALAVGGLGASAVRSLADATTRTRDAAELLARETITQLPRLMRLERVGPTTRVSIGSVLDEQAQRAPDDVFFLFEGRGHTYGAAKRRVDNIVRGLISVGVRQGEHVGVLMETRPSSLALVAALSRLGAVAVMLRPSGSVAAEAELGNVSRIIADPEHGPAASEQASVPVLVLGGGGEPRELGFGLTDMERIDVDGVRMPGWFRPNPGRARDLAVLTFTGQGEHLRANRITNARWALSAFGTASAAALSPADTVYSVSPIYHPAGLLTSIGGALAGGARLALTANFEPVTFWDEVRRYGVTVVSYTWTLLADLLDAPPSAREQHHPIRLFVGSGLPVGLWRRILNRFSPAQVLEFYASTEGRAVLANVSSHKVGAKGRPLPGSAEVRVAVYDVEAARLVEGDDGFAVVCRPGEVGMLLARTSRGGLSYANPLRGVFTAGDAWLATGDLFRVDADGDYWLVGDVNHLVRTADGLVPPGPAEDALGTIDAIELVAVYGVPVPQKGHDLLVAAVTLPRSVSSNGVRRLNGAALADAVASLSPPERPEVVRVVPRIPTTPWYRLRKEHFADDGIPTSSDARPAWVLDRETGGYEKLTAARRQRLLGQE